MGKEVERVVEWVAALLIGFVMVPCILLYCAVYPAWLLFSMICDVVADVIDNIIPPRIYCAAIDTPAVQDDRLTILAPLGNILYVNEFTIHHWVEHPIWLKGSLNYD